VLEGLRPEVPSREELPGPDAATFAGLDDFVALSQSICRSGFVVGVGGVLGCVCLVVWGCWGRTWAAGRRRERRGWRDRRVRAALGRSWAGRERREAGQRPTFQHIVPRLSSLLRRV